jgi:hypothetical protein
MGLQFFNGAVPRNGAGQPKRVIDVHFVGAMLLVFIGKCLILME